MKSGSPVVASDIPVHREIFADAAEYFNPYSVDALSRAIHTVINPEGSGRRDELIARGAIVSTRYSLENILPQWRAFLQLPEPAAPCGHGLSHLLPAQLGERGGRVFPLFPAVPRPPD